MLCLCYIVVCVIGRVPDLPIHPAVDRPRGHLETQELVFHVCSSYHNARVTPTHSIHCLSCPHCPRPSDQNNPSKQSFHDWCVVQVMKGDYNSKVDVWSLGCVVIEMASAQVVRVDTVIRDTRS